MHGDHIGGLMAGDKLAFPNATVRADKHDADFWLSQANMDAAQRKRAYADAAKRGYWVAAAHLAFPGIGHVRSEGKAYAWVPANYAPLP